MKRKELVFKYLDGLFKNAKVVRSDEGGINVLIGDTILYALGHKKNMPTGNYFSYSEFNFIKNMFGFDKLETVDIIREYLSLNVDERLINLPFTPHL